MKKAVLIFLAVLIAAAAYLLFAKPRFEVHITAEQIQNRLEKMFPYEKSHLFILKTVISNPRVRLEKGSDRIGIVCDVSVFITGVETLKSKFDAETAIRYDRKSGDLFLADPELKQFKVRDIKASTEKIVREIVWGSVLEILASQPIYRLDKTDTKGKIAAAILKDVKIKDGSLSVVFGL